MAIHVTYELNLSDLPPDCVRDCSSSGDVSEAVEFWTEELGFTVERAPAIECLSGYGAWEDEQLESASDEWLAQRILWLACGDFSEFLTWKARNPGKPDSEASYGSDIFILE